MKLGKRAAYLKKCIVTQELVALYETSCTVRKRIFEEHIKPVIRVSYTAFNEMLNEVNPQKQLDEINEKIKHLNTPKNENN